MKRQSFGYDETSAKGVEGDSQEIKSPFDIPSYSKTIAWGVVFSAMIFYVLCSGTSNMLTPILQLILNEFGQNANYGSLLASTHTLGSILVVVPLGLAMNKWGFRRIGFVGYFALIVGSAWGGTLANTEATLVAARFLQGISYAFPPVVGIYVVSQWFPKDRLSLPIAVVSSSAPLAKVLVSQMSKIAIPLGGWRAEFLLMAILGIFGLILYAVFMKPGPGYAWAQAERAAKSEKEQRKAPVTTVLRNPLIWCVVITNFCFVVGIRGFSPFANMVYVENCGIENNVASDIFSLFAFAQMLSGFFFGWLANRLPRYRGRIISILITLYFFGTISFFLLNQAWQAYLFNFGVGFLGGVVAFCNICLPVFAKQPEVLAMALTLHNFIGKFLSGLVAPYIMSSIQVATGSWTGCAIPMAICAIVGSACILVAGFNLDKRSESVPSIKESITREHV